jgi:release factor glutamine methyltransferase
MRFEDKVEKLRIHKHGGKETSAFLADVKALTDGEAFEYLLGEVLFAGAKVDLSLRPMIPRPETEHWVKQAIEDIKSGDSRYTLRVLDLFSGSGNVGLAMLKNFDEATVDFIEFDPKLKEQIELSITKNNIKKTRARVVTGDTWEGAVGKYDVILAVPPYVPPQMKDEVMQELSAEDPLSFFDKEDGFYYHKQVLSHAKDFLNDGGTLYLEFDITQRERIEQLAKENGWASYSFLIDPYGHECVIKIVR